MAKDIYKIKDKLGVYHNLEDRTARSMILGLKDVAITGSYNDLKDVPSVSLFPNDAGYLTSHQNLDHKQDKLVSGQNIKTINGHSIVGRGNLDFDVNDITFDGIPATTYLNQRVSEIRQEIMSLRIPVHLSELDNDVGYLTEHQSLSGYATESYVDEKIDLLLGEGEISQTFDTIKEVSDYLAQHGSDYTALVETVNGKADTTDIPTNVSELANDAGYLTQHQALKTINGSSLVGSGDIVLKPHHNFGAWTTTGTTIEFCQSIVSDDDAIAGMSYLGQLRCSDLPGGLGQAEAVVDIISNTSANGKQIRITLTSMDTAPGHWEYVYGKMNGNYYSPRGWIGLQNEITSDNKLSSSLVSGLALVATSGSYQDLTNKPNIPSLAGYATEAWVGQQGYLTEHQSLTAYALKSELPTVPTNISAFTNDSGYLTEHQSLASYALKSELPTALSDLTNDAGYAKLNVTQTFTDVQSFNQGIKLGNVNGSIKLYQDGSGFFKIAFGNTDAFKIGPDLIWPSVDEAVSIGSSDYKFKEIYLTESIKDGTHTFKLPSNTGTLALTSAIPTKVSDLTNDAGYLTSHQSLSGYATKTYVDNQISTLLGEGEVAAAFDTFKEIADYLSTHGTEYSNLVAAVNGKADTSSLATVATSGSYNDLINKPTIPTVPTNISAFTNDAGYLTQHQSLAGYATQQWVDQQGFLKSNGLPTAPSSNGDYQLLLNVNNGVSTYSWEEVQKIDAPVISFHSTIDYMVKWTTVVGATYYIIYINGDPQPNMVTKTSINLYDYVDGNDAEYTVSVKAVDSYSKTSEMSNSLIWELPDAMIGVTGMDNSTGELTWIGTAFNKTGITRSTSGNYVSVSSDLDTLWPFNAINYETVGENKFTKLPRGWVTWEKDSNNVITGVRVTPIRYNADSFIPDCFLVPGTTDEYIDYYYMGTYEGSAANNIMASKTGQTCAVNISRTTARSYCTNNGAGYQQLDFSAWIYYTILCTIYLKSINSQQALYAGRVSTSSASVTGTTDDITTLTGYNTSTGCVRLLGVENPYGNIWKWVDGVNFNNEVMYITKDPTKFNDNLAVTGNTLLDLTRCTTSDSFITAFKVDTDNPSYIIVSAVGGSDSTYYGDKYWYNSGQRALLAGGRWSNSSDAGSWALHGNTDASNTNTSIGARLCLRKIPENAGE